MKSIRERLENNTAIVLTTLTVAAGGVACNGEVQTTKEDPSSSATPADMETQTDQSSVEGSAVDTESLSYSQRYLMGQAVFESRDEELQTIAPTFENNPDASINDIVLDLVSRLEFAYLGSLAGEDDAGLVLSTVTNDAELLSDLSTELSSLLSGDLPGNSTPIKNELITTLREANLAEEADRSDTEINLVTSVVYGESNNDVTTEYMQLELSDYGDRYVIAG